MNPQLRREMEGTGDKETRNAPSTPVSSECFKATAEDMGLRLDDAETDVLRQIVQENEVLLATVDASPRAPSEDPFDFMRFVRTWSQLHGK